MTKEKPNKKIQKLLTEAQNCHKDNRLKDLEKVLKKIILVDKNYFPAFYNLAILLQKQKKIEEAIKLYKKTLEINPNHIDSMFNLMNCYEDSNKIDEAIKTSEKICKLYPDKYEGYYAYARLIHKKGGNTDKAYGAYKKTLSINNNFKFAEIGLGQVCKAKGNFSEAKEIFQKIIESYKDPMAYFEIADFLNKNEIEKNIKELKVLENNDKQSDENKVYMYFAMGRLLEKNKNYQKAFYYYNLGNNLKRKYFDYSINHDEDKFECLKEIIDKFGVNKKKNIGYKSSKPIFIIGMPRSGTTLIEQIVASHSEVFGAGELLFFSDIIRNKVGLKNKKFLEYLKNSLNEKDFFKIGKNYIDEIEKLSKKNKYLTNKLPGNFINIGLIKLSLPYAKIIHCERNSLDTCFSCFKTNFTKGNHFSFSLDELGSFYKLYEKQMRYYKEKFGEEILNIKYENVVENIETETKKILDFLDLSFEKNCLEFYKNKRSIQTASIVQARKPIYKSSVNYWKNYENFLKPLTNKINL